MKWDRFNKYRYVMAIEEARNVSNTMYKVKTIYPIRDQESVLESTQKHAYIVTS